MIKEPSQVDILKMETERRVFDEYASIPGIHFCPDWDDMLIWAGCHQYHVCTCFPAKANKKLNGANNA